MASKLSDAQLRDLLQSGARIAVVGLSPVPARPSYGVSRYMISKGYEIFGVRPASPPEILGRPCVEALSQLTEDIDIIDVFRNSEAVPQLVDEIEAWMKDKPADRRPKALWLQEGVTNPAAEEKAEKLGLKVISNKCILKEHARLM
ncbi:MAG: CoA-binding protein [Bdellovibrionota bacterium]